MPSSVPPISVCGGADERLDSGVNDIVFKNIVIVDKIIKILVLYNFIS